MNKYLLNNTKFKFFTHVKRMNNKTTEVIPASVMQISGDNSKYFLALVVFLN